MPEGKHQILSDGFYVVVSVALLYASKEMIRRAPEQSLESPLVLLGILGFTMAGLGLLVHGLDLLRGFRKVIRHV